MKKKIELYQRDDGFYAGRELKDGRMSADTYKVTAEDIMTMFTEFFQDYCQETNQKQLLMQDAKGRLFVTMLVPEKSAKEQTRRDNGKVPQKSKRKRNETKSQHTVHLNY